MSDKFKIGIAGAGAMGTGIAMVAALAGNQVVIMDANSNAISSSKKNIQSYFEKREAKGKMTLSQVKHTLNNISFSSDVNGFSGCDLVIEAIIESLEIKKELFAAIEEVVSNDCILATNTSSLAVVAIASACRNRDRVVGIHFFNPAIIMPLVEIIPALTTTDECVQKSRKMIDSWNKVTVVAKDTPGFIVNRIARPFYSEALKLYEEGIADMATIDWAMKEFGGFRMGPFELMDFIGNDVNYKVTETVWQQMFYDPKYKPSLTQKRLYEAGLFGRKAGRGYYDYSDGKEIPQPDKNDVKGRYLFERILVLLINEAADALYLGIAGKEDIETAMTKGVNYPKGLLAWADEFGVAKVLNLINQLYVDYADDKYRPSILLKKMVAENRKFFN